VGINVQLDQLIVQIEYQIPPIGRESKRRGIMFILAGWTATLEAGDRQ
jgi:hypothetical protein